MYASVCVWGGGGCVSIECNIECTFNEINTQDTISGIWSTSQAILGA